MRKFFFTFLILISYGFSAQSNEENMWSFSLGQFDINDTVDSSEIRFEYLYANNFLRNNYDLKPFLGAMRNGDNGKYIYSGLRKDIGVSEKWFLLQALRWDIMIEEIVKTQDIILNLEVRLSFHINLNQVEQDLI